MSDVKRYATVVIKRLDDSWALADWVPDDAFIALEIKYDALRARLAEVERLICRVHRIAGVGIKRSGSSKKLLSNILYLTAPTQEPTE